MIVTRTDLSFDVTLLADALDEVSRRSNGFDQVIGNQISLTHRAGARDKLNDANGSLYDKESQRFIAQESDFSEFNEDFKATYFGEVYQRVCAWTPGKIGRVRLMRVRSHQCYSVHSDRETRYHLAIITDPACFLFFADVGTGFHIPADGHLYHTDTRQRHTAFNGSPHDRIHLVFNNYAREPDADPHHL